MLSLVTPLTLTGPPDPVALVCALLPGGHDRATEGVHRCAIFRIELLGHVNPGSSAETPRRQARRRLEKELPQVEDELRNVERVILAGVVSETTAALVQDREAQRRSLKGRPEALAARQAAGPLRVDADAITRQLARLDDLLRRDVARDASSAATPSAA